MKTKKVLPLVDILLFSVVVIWAANFTVVKLALREIPPLAFNVLRFIASSLIFLAYYHFRIGDYGFIWKNWKRLLFIALSGNTIMQVLFIVGIDNTTATNASILYQTVPLFVVLITVFFEKVRVGLVTWAAVMLSFFGIVMVMVSGGEGFSLSMDTLYGDSLMLATSLGWSIFTVYAKPLIEETSMMHVVSLTFIIGTVFLIPFGIPDFISMDWGAISGAAWGGLAFSFLGANVIGYIIWFYAVSKVGSVQTAIFSNLVPILAVSIAAIFLGEVLTVKQILGGLCIISGVTLTRLQSVINKRNSK